MRRAAVSEANRRHCPERSEGIAEAIAKPEAARPEPNTAARHCEPFFRKGEAINVIVMGKARSNLVLDSGNSFEIASLTAFVRNDG